MKIRRTFVVTLLIIGCLLTGCGAAGGTTQSTQSTQSAVAEKSYAYSEYPLERNGIKLHLDKMVLEGTNPEKNILLVHGVTYSSHEFDINYEDYSFVRWLASEGYAVWRIDIAGFGQSGEVQDGFMPDSNYASEDINAAVEKIVKETGQDKIDVLGWSWGTVTTSLFAKNHPEHLRKLILYAPIMSGLGEGEVKEAFHHNTWEHAADDFVKKADGTFDYSIADANLIEMWCSSCWHYDRESSPNGGRRDLLVSKDTRLIDLSKITVPTLVICGDSDPYLNYDHVNKAKDELPEGSQLKVIKGGSHVVFIEKPYYKEFREGIKGFL
ncbi:MAG: alpha/beta hydrolase [Lachnospiraceae bacterium]|nr:alpha/beta hydrolase [Lachnospiraceae bacterium]